MSNDYSNAVALYDAGLSIGDVADFYGVTRQAMHQILGRRGCKFRSQKRTGSENHMFRGGSVGDDRARNITEKAIERGILVRPKTCAACGAGGTMRDGRSVIQAHHDDYNKPLEVRWLCQPCHHEWHKTNQAVPLSGELPRERRSHIKKR